MRFDLLAVRPLTIGEARARGDLLQTLALLRSKARWNERGAPRREILAEIDPDFIRHRLHYDRMMKGGVDDAGERVRRAKGIKQVEMRVTVRECEVTVDGSREWDKDPHEYRTRVRFSNYDLIRRVREHTWTERARLLLEDNLRVDCDCNAFRYYHRYAATQKKFALVPENRPASTKNPGERGGVCKHLEHTLRYLGANYATIASAMKAHSDALMENHMSTLERINAALGESATAPKLTESVIPSDFMQTLDGLIEIASRLSMAKTVGALKTAAAMAKLDGAPIPPVPSQPDLRTLGAPNPDR